MDNTDPPIGNTERANPPRRTLDDYAMYQGPRHYSSIVIPHIARKVEIKPAFLNLISAHQFSRKDYEDPYAHLDNFYGLVATMDYNDNEREAAYMMLFPFYLVARYVHAKFELLTFQQGADEAFYEAWERYQVLRCEFYGGEHATGHCAIPNNNQEEEVQYINNPPRQGNFPNNPSYNGQFSQSWRPDSGPSNRQPPYQQPFQQGQHPPMHERQNKLEDTLEKFMQASMTNQKNTEASIRNMETQVGQLAKQMAEQSSDGRQFSANTQTNSKEHCKAITTRSKKVISPNFGKNLAVDEEVLDGCRAPIFGRTPVARLVWSRHYVLCSQNVEKPFCAQMLERLVFELEFWNRESVTDRGRARISKDKDDTDHLPSIPLKYKEEAVRQPLTAFLFEGNERYEREERYTTLLQWAFIPQRRVELQHNEYPKFLETLDRLKWGAIASTHDKFDPDVVREFYANAYPPEKGGEVFEDKSWVRGKVIRRTYFANIEGRPNRIYRKGMTTLAQIWMIFCLHNVIPNSHVSSLPLSDCYLLYCILAGVEIDVVRLMATEIYKTAVKRGKKGTIGFSSLITSLCARQGVQVNPTEPMKKPITKQYIKQNCKEDNVEPHGQQPSQEPQQQHQKQQHFTLEQKLDRLTLHMEHHYPETQFWLSPEEFTASFPWLGVSPTYPGEAGAGEPSGFGAAEDEETHDEEL
ncbi:hypothetical protein Lal_00004050 [Lupinus albus]|nr:hypothetical protein Lal_00004050 [Lupinus albus]